MKHHNCQKVISTKESKGEIPVDKAAGHICKYKSFHTTNYPEQGGAARPQKAGSLSRGKATEFSAPKTKDLVLQGMESHS